MVTRVYGGWVNYRDAAGDYMPIDDSLQANGDGSVDNAANRYDVRLPKTLADPVSVSDGSVGVDFALAGADGSRTVKDDSATYSDALSGVDVSYLAAPDGVKEQLTLQDRSSPARTSPMSTRRSRDGSRRRPRLG